MFELTQQDCKLVSVNPRAELHGEDTKLACDLKFRFTASNSILNQFNDRLLVTLYKPAKPDEMDLADQGMGADYMPKLRFPEMSKVAWAYKGAGYRMVIEIGISGHEDIILINTEIDKFVFDCKEGGSVEVSFRLIAHPNEKEMGQLCALIQNDVDLTLEPPSAEQRAQMRIDDALDEAGEEEEEGESIFDQAS